MLKRFGQCLGLSSLILVTKYVDLLGGGDNVRLHTPLPLRGIAFAQIADIFAIGFAIFIVLTAFERTRFYKWVKLLIVILVPPYLMGRPQEFSPRFLREGRCGLADSGLGSVRSTSFREVPRLVPQAAAGR